MKGQVLGSRYEIRELVGGGGMALVYMGYDKLLNRQVAIKILREQYVHDDEFISRFNREAQAAASLSHPNVVSIYDVGQESDVHYIVMEYIEGYNLNEKIKEVVTIPVEEAVRIAIQICDALDHAHQNHIIHRDIKPHNILLGKNGRVKVTDFGIARATTASSITQTGSVIGSVHYFSPEHAKGVSAGAKSDLYSLGIVLYQMLTGKLPFLGESPISVALKHLQEHVEEPRKINPMIPQSVENVILKSLRKNPNERYQTAKEMMEDLESSLHTDRRSEPKIVFYSPEDDDKEITRVMPAIRPDMLTPSVASEFAEESTSEPLKGDKGTSKKKWKKTLIWCGVIIVFLLGLWFGVKALLAKFEVDEVKVPNVVQLDLEEAITKLEGSGLEVDPNLVRMHKEDIPKDQVYQQDKTPETMTKRGALVKLWVSDGPELAIMPEITGKSLTEVYDELQAIGISRTQIEETERVFSEDPLHTVLEQAPLPKEEVDPKQVIVKIKVSKGRETVEMPDLINLSEADAYKLLADRGLKVEKEIEESGYCEQGKIIKQHPYQPNDQAEIGSGITVTICKGLPADAKESIVEFDIGPAEVDKESQVKIVVTDAMGETVEQFNEKISKITKFSVRIVTSANKNAVINVYRDDVHIWNETRTYRDDNDNHSIPTFGPKDEIDESDSNTDPDSDSNAESSDPEETSSEPNENEEEGEDSNDND